MEMQELPDEVKVTGKNKDEGISVAHLFSSAKTEQAIVDTFFCAPTNWKNVTNAQGKAVKYPNHWHFSSTTIPCKTARFLTVMDTHGNNRADMKVVRQGNTSRRLDYYLQSDGERESGNQRHPSSGKGFFEIRCRQEGRCDYHHRSSTRETGQ